MTTPVTIGEMTIGKLVDDHSSHVLSTLFHLSIQRIVLFFLKKKLFNTFIRMLCRSYFSQTSGLELVLCNIFGGYRTVPQFFFIFMRKNPPPGIDWRFPSLPSSRHFEFRKTFLLEVLAFYFR